MNIVNSEWIFNQLEILDAFEVEEVEQIEVIRSLERCLGDWQEYRVCRLAGLALGPRFSGEVMCAELVIGHLLGGYNDAQYFEKKGYASVADFAASELKISHSYANKLIDLSKSLDIVSLNLWAVEGLPWHKVHWYHSHLNHKNTKAWISAIECSGKKKDSAMFKRLLRRNKAKHRPSHAD